MPVKEQEDVLSTKNTDMATRRISEHRQKAVNPVLLNPCCDLPQLLHSHAAASGLCCQRKRAEEENPTQVAYKPTF